MNRSPTRRQTLQLGAVGLAAGVAGCLGNDTPAATLAFEGFDRIDDDALPDRTAYATADRSFPNYRLYEAADPDIALILLHTAVFDSRVLEPLASGLAAANVAHVFTPDLRGHGPEPERRGDLSFRYQLEDDITHLIDRVETLFSDVEVVVGGHGTGGGVAVRFAARPAGRRADGFLFLAPYLGREAPTTKPAMGGWAEFYGDRIFLLRVVTGFGLEWNQDMTSVEYEIPDDLWDGTETLEHAYRLMVSYTPAEDDLERLADRPMLTVVGTADETAVSDAYDALVGTEDSQTLEQLEGASHFDLTLTETAIETIETWVDETSFERRGREGSNSSQ